MVMDKKAAEYWAQFLKDTGRDKDTPCYSVFHFELTKELAESLLELVLSGKKKATAASRYSFEIEGERLPETGDLSVVTDFEGNPRCIIETAEVTLIPYKDMTYEICSREGEDDNLESWQRGHEKFFRNEGAEMGYTFSEDLIVVFEDFRVVYQ